MPHGFGCFDWLSVSNGIDDEVVIHKTVVGLGWLVPFLSLPSPCHGA
ncbi:MAG: hypothetical protein RI915_2186, partial [Pseudomonadota bacterium]